MPEVGDPIPDVTLTSASGPVRVRDLIGQRALVLYFYPKDETPGCTAQACAFRDRHEEFLERDAVVIGISDDDAASHERFAAQWDLPYPLLSDPGGVVRRAYGVTGLLGLLKGRETFVIDRDGTVLHVVRDRFLAQAHIDEALQALEGQRRS